MGADDDRYILSMDLARWRTRFTIVLAAVGHGMAQRMGTGVALLIVLISGLLLTLGVAVGSTQLYEATAEGDGVQLLDGPVLRTAQMLRSPPLDVVVAGYSAVGGPVPMTVLCALVMIVLALKRRSWTPVALIVPAAAGSVLITVVTKQFIGRARPPVEEAIPPYEFSDSFPSGHSLNSLVLAGTIAYLLMLRLRSRRAVIGTGVLAGGFTLTMGLSRVYLGHHWFTDVLMAWVLATVWLLIVITAHRLHLSWKVPTHPLPDHPMGNGSDEGCRQRPAPPGNCPTTAQTTPARTDK